MSERIIKTLFTEFDIKIAIETVAKEISDSYDGENLVILSLLNGSFMFTADLVRKINLPIELEFVKAKSYEGTTSTGVVVLDEHFDPTVFDKKHVLIVDDILDTGLTLTTLQNLIKKKSQALSISTCVLLNKLTEKRTSGYSANYSCFTIPDEFVIGYGLDYKGRYRNLPYIGVLEVKSHEQ